MKKLSFNLLKKEKNTKARLGEITTSNGIIQTPVYMPVGTQATVKTLTNNQLYELGTEIILANTYHLMLRPGIDIIKKSGGLHEFMNWSRPILTDSGGFQVFSLASLNDVKKEGVYFQSHIDGTTHFLGAEKCMELQKFLGSDIVMPLDWCSIYPSNRSSIELAMERTHQWANLSRNYDLKPHQSLFGIQQGGTYSDLRIQSAKELVKLNFDGYAIGGLAVGEPVDIMNKMIDESMPYFPEDKPRYMMGMGTPRNIIESVMRGIDMFDCVLPTRNARNGTAFTWSGKISIKARKYADDLTPLDPQLNCYTSQFSKAYIRHLLNVDEVTGLTLVTMQNLAFYFDFIKKLRQAIKDDTLLDFYEHICKIYPL